MAISNDSIQKLLSLLRPYLRNESERRAYLIRALGTNADALNLIWNEPVNTFIPNMVQTLVAFGELTSGKPALCALLEVIREDVGVDVKDSIDELLQAIKKELLRINNNQGNWSQTPVNDSDKTLKEIEFVSPRIFTQKQATVANQPKQPTSPANQTQSDQDDLSSERFGANYYAKLRDLLAAQDWKAADQETAKRMCQAMNPQEEGELLISDFQKFPCQDLLNIDRLWVKYSNGQFGFSVQKAIYLECGGELLPISSAKSLVKNVERFGDRVGWRTKGIWRYHSDVTSSSFIPKGYFPFVWRRSCNFMPEEASEEWPINFISARQYGRFVSPILFRLQPGKAGICFVFLFSHMENCELYLLKNN